jgi:AhpC/TSA family protein
MRLGVVMSCLFAVAGCGAPTDPTPNRPAVTGGDYPGGPYGYASGSVMTNLGFIGKVSPSVTDYSQLPMKQVSLSDLRTTGTKLIVVDGAARWCYYCNQDQPAMKQLESDYGPRGVVTIQILAEGGYGITATQDDINRWAASHTLSGTIVIDPERQLVKYADVNAFPLYMVLRASNMKIEYMATGGMVAAPLGPVLDQLLAQ